MGKHSKTEGKGKTAYKKMLIAVLTIIISIGIVVFLVINIRKDTKIVSISNSTTIQGEKLVFKSTSEKCRIMEYTFKDNILKEVKVYEQFENREDFEARKKNYEEIDNITIININEQDLSIEIEKRDFGSDTGKSYEEIYDKYLVQIIGAYQVIN